MEFTRDLLSHDMAGKTPFAFTDGSIDHGDASSKSPIGDLVSDKEILKDLDGILQSQDSEDSQGSSTCGCGAGCGCSGAKCGCATGGNMDDEDGFQQFEDMVSPFLKDLKQMPLQQSGALNGIDEKAFSQFMQAAQNLSDVFKEKDPKSVAAKKLDQMVDKLEDFWG